MPDRLTLVASWPHQMRAKECKTSGIVWVRVLRSTALVGYWPYSYTSPASILFAHLGCNGIVTIPCWTHNIEICVGCIIWFLRCSLVSISCSVEPGSSFLVYQSPHVHVREPCVWYLLMFGQIHQLAMLNKWPCAHHEFLYPFTWVCVKTYYNILFCAGMHQSHFTWGIFGTKAGLWPPVLSRL